MKSLYIFLSILNTFTTINGSYVEIKGPDTISYSYYDYPSEKDLLSKFEIEGYVEKYEFKPHPLFNKVGNQDITLIIHNKEYYDEKTFKLIIYDDIEPIIYGPDTLTFDINHPLPIDNILTFYHVYDEIDQNLKLKIRESDYDYHSLNVGKYFLNLYAEDNHKNFAEKTVDINITKKENKLYFNYESEIKLIQNKNYNSTYLVNLLISNHLLEDKNYISSCFKDDISFISFPNLGRYPISLNLKTADDEYEISFYALIEKDHKRISFLEKLLTILKRIIERISL